MANQIREGLFLLNKNTLKAYSPADVGSLRTELERMLRDARAETPPQEDAGAVQTRSRKLVRLSAAIQILGAATARR